MAPDTLLSPPLPLNDTPQPEPEQIRAPVARRPWLGFRFVGLLASARLTILFIVILSSCIALASFLEASYGYRLAQELVYRTWWFLLLLGGLALNAFAALLARLPWKRSQAGALILYSGLLTLLGGGLMTTVWGAEGELVLINSPDQAIQQSNHLRQTAEMVPITGRHRLEVFRVPDAPTPDHPVVATLEQVLEGGEEVAGDVEQRLAGHYWRAEFAPGSLVWEADGQIQPHYPWILRALQVCGDRFAVREWPVSDGTLTLHNFYPHADQWPVCAAPEEDPGVAALHVRLQSSATVRPLDRWLASLPAFDPDPSPVRLELLQLQEPALLSEFLTPPPGINFTQLGQLVLVVGPQRSVYRVALDALLTDMPEPLGDSGLTLTLKKSGHLLSLLGHEAGVPQGGPPYPSVQFELAGATGRGTYVVCARLPQMPALQSGDDVGAVAGWLHSPELPHVEGQLGTVQFLQGPGRKLYVRTYGLDGLNAPGFEVDASDPERLIALPWKTMSVEARILNHVPHARQQMTVLPRDTPVGSEADNALPAAVRATLQVGEQKQDFMVRLGRQPARLQIGNAMYFVRYVPATQPLGFHMTLEKTEQTTDPGSNRPASCRSEVSITRPDSGQQLVTRQTVALNAPLNQNGWKVLQAGFEPLTDSPRLPARTDTEGRPLGRCHFTVIRDPGLPVKIAGSSLLALGLIVLFAMRTVRARPNLGVVASA